MVEGGPKIRFTLLQAGRGVAALLVLLFHLSTTIFASSKFWNVEIDGGLMRFGHEGVAFFFVLSGFIILHAHLADIGRPERLGDYGFKRLTRIYLPYWVVVFPLIAIYLLFPSMGKPELTAHAVLLNSPLLIGLNSHAALSVAWTLFHEIAFYALFALAILDRRIGIAVLLIWQLACAVSFFMEEPLHYTLHPINLLFGMGMASRIALGRWRVSAPLAVMWGGIVVTALLGLVLDYTQWVGGYLPSLLFGAASCAFVLGGVEAERQGRVSAPASLKLLGDASYALYLVHYPLLSILARLFMAPPLRMIPAPIAYLLMTGACILAAVLFHKLIEKPLMGLVTRKSSPIGGVGEPRPAR
ncbi:MAG TPA: acyltransferase [Sphingobium sp.]|uniref:acyltransferase family protein n=1 Tax=Sphingobium sp. TaxID=1912891 RepID=UPI002ED11F39